MASVLLEARPYRPFKSSEEYLEAMREDLAEWLNTMYPELMINADNFMDRLDTGVALCKHANYVRQAAEDYLARRQARNKSMTRSMTSGLAGPILAMGNVHYLPAAKSGTFFARDNVSNFITWCRKALKIFECLLFETDDLIMRKNEKHVILCLLEVARRGAKFGMLAPMLVQMERQIDREIAADNKANGIGCGTQTDFSNETNNISTATEFDTDTEDEDDDGPVLVYGPQPQIITNDLKSLDEMVRDLVEKCTCPSQFPMVRVSEGKYRIGDTKVLIFVRILRSHVMVRVGGGWDTLSHYLDKHDPCRCRAQHRSSVAARLIPRTNNQTNGIELHRAQVIFERSPPVARRVVSNFNGNATGSPSFNNHHYSQNLTTNVGGQMNSTLSPPSNSRGRSRSPTPQRKLLNNTGDITNTSEKYYNVGQNNSASTSPSFTNRSISPSPRRFADLRKKQTSLESGTTAINALSSHNSSKNHLDLINNSTHVHFEDNHDVNNKLDHHNSSLITTATTEGSTKFENISDNGSEISDEGYRSLGLIQSGNNAQKRESLHSQTSVDDAENNVRLDQNSSDSQISPTEEQSSSITKTPEKLDSNCIDLLDSSNSLITPSPPEEQEQQTENEHSLQNDKQDQSITSKIAIQDKMPSFIHGRLNIEETTNNFEQSGVFITDDDITVDIASATGLRKTGFSDKIYGSGNISNFNSEENVVANHSNSLKKISSKIPRSPVPTRRRSVDNTSDCGSDLTVRTGLPILSRKQPIYRSVRNATSTSKISSPPSTPKLSAKSAKTSKIRSGISTPPPERKFAAESLPRHAKDVTNTWSGRSSLSKKRPSISAETFTPTSSTGNFTRNSKGRSSAIVYDSNGRRVRGGSTSLTTSPIKTASLTTSPLAQQLLEAAGNAKSDAQILQKMKQLLTQYSNIMNNRSNNLNQNKSPKNPEFDDFTTAWVHSNGVLDRSSTCSPPAKGRSKRSSAASSIESTNSKDVSLNVTNRRDRGLSRIPAPVRNHTELY